jgi:hypothetical protein
MEIFSPTLSFLRIPAVATPLLSKTHPMLAIAKNRTFETHKCPLLPFFYSQRLLFPYFSKPPLTVGNLSKS